MSKRDRILQLTILALIGLHVLAAVRMPGYLWGISHLAVWPIPAGVVWTLLATVSYIWEPSRRSSSVFGLPAFASQLCIE